MAVLDTLDAEGGASGARVAVLGLGLIGGSVLRSLEDVSGWDPDPATRALAAAAGYQVAETLEAAVSGAAVAVVAAPPSGCVASVLAALDADSAVTVIDVCSVKGAVVEAVLEAAPASAARYVPTHPLAGAATSGFTSSSSSLLAGAPWAVCPHRLLDPTHLWEAIRLISALAGSAIGCEPEVHDRIVAHASHAVQLASSALASYTPPALAAQVAALHGGGLRDATRVAASDPVLWRDIISHNAVATTEALDDLIACLLGIRGAVADGDWNAVEAAVALGRRRKAVMENVRWGPGRWAEEEWPLSELTTRVLAAGAAGQALRSAGSASEGRVQVLVHAQNLPNAGS